VQILFSIGERQDTDQSPSKGSDPPPIVITVMLMFVNVNLHFFIGVLNPFHKSPHCPSAERRLCRFYFSIYSCTHENKIV
jgi:hypothetical protein